MFRAETMRTEDFPFAVQLANIMNWNMSSEDFEFMSKLEPQGCFILFRGAERLGIATSISYGQVGWFGNLIIKEEYREKGAGTFLVKHAIDYLKNEGVETIGLYAYPNLIEFYKNFGFKPNMDFLVFQGKSVSPVTERTLQLQKARKQDMPALMDLDYQCFGACRKKLLEPILLSRGNLCYVSTEDDEIIGYGAAKVYEDMAEVGPLVCRQDHVDVALALLQTILGKLRNLDIFICVPAAETALLELLSKAGFRENFRVARMFLGTAVAKNCTYIAESLERG
jgi:ribosomal protein S18 acetylase RimI-like enzyme